MTINRLPLAWLCWLTAGLNTAVAEYRTGPQEVHFTARSDGSKQAYVLLLPEDFRPDQAHHLLIALHGHGSDRWQYIKDGRAECRAARDVGAAQRLIFVSPDYRARTSWMGPQAEADVLQIIEGLKKKYRLGKVFLCGASMGGSSALTFTARHPQLIAGVIAMNGTANHLEYDKFQDAIAASFGGTKKQVPEEYRQRSAEFFPGRFTMPVAITTGGKDTLVPPQSCLRLAAAIKKTNPKVLLIHRPNGGHSTDYADSKAALEFVILPALGPEKK